MIIEQPAVLPTFESGLPLLRRKKLEKNDDGGISILLWTRGRRYHNSSMERSSLVLQHGNAKI